MLFPKTHVCPPLWLVWDEEADPGAEYAMGKPPIRAADAEFAAMDWAVREDDRGEYRLAGGNDVVVHVRPWDKPTAPVLLFRVTGRMEPVYTATILVKAAAEVSHV